MTKNPKSENVKNIDWKVPMDLPSVKPEDYAKNTPSARGSAAPGNSASSRKNDNK